MASVPSTDYMVLATSLLDSLGDDQIATDGVLLQLQALFGPMLTSALQLVDKREVVRVSLPQGRYVYQVTASTGKPYTLHLDLPSYPSELKVEEAKPTTEPPPDGPPDSPTLGNTNDEILDMDEMGEAQDNEESKKAAAEQESHSMARRTRLRKEMQAIERMYCPCPGYAYNSLAGEKNVLCKHLLAAVIGWKTSRDLKTEVPLHGVLSLLGLEDKVENEDKPEVKEERFG